MESNLIDIQEIDLMSELVKDTETKVTATIPEMNKETSEPGEEKPAEESSDFAPEEKKVPEINEAAQVFNYSPEKTAKLIVDGGGIFIETVFPFLYKQSLSTEESAMLQSFRYKFDELKKNRTATLNESEQKGMEITIDFDDYCKQLPLNKDEQKSIIEPLTEVLKKINFKASPETALIIACLLVFLPRSLPLGANYFKK